MPTHKHMSEADYKRRFVLYSERKDDGAGFGVGLITDSLLDAIRREGDTIESIYTLGYSFYPHVFMAIGMTSRGDRYMVMDVGGPFAVRLEEGE